MLAPALRKDPSGASIFALGNACLVFFISHDTCGVFEEKTQEQKPDHTW
jgi:hypothetical protein